MRLKRFCEVKEPVKSWVNAEVPADYKKGGEAHEALEMSLLETLRALGPHQDKPAQVRVHM